MRRGRQQSRHGVGSSGYGITDDHRREEMSKRHRRRERQGKMFVLLGGLWALLVFTAFAAGIWILAHFVIKAW